MPFKVVETKTGSWVVRAENEVDITIEITDKSIADEICEDFNNLEKDPMTIWDLIGSAHLNKLNPDA